MPFRPCALSSGQGPRPCAWSDLPPLTLSFCCVLSSAPHCMTLFISRCEPHSPAFFWTPHHASQAPATPHRLTASLDITDPLSPPVTHGPSGLHASYLQPTLPLHSFAALHSVFAHHHEELSPFFGPPFRSHRSYLSVALGTEPPPAIPLLLFSPLLYFSHHPCQHLGSHLGMHPPRCDIQALMCWRRRQRHIHSRRLDMRHLLTQFTHTRTLVAPWRACRSSEKREPLARSFAAARCCRPGRQRGVPIACTIKRHQLAAPLRPLPLRLPPPPPPPLPPKPHRAVAAEPCRARAATTGQRARAACCRASLWSGFNVQSHRSCVRRSGRMATQVGGRAGGRIIKPLLGTSPQATSPSVTSPKLPPSLLPQWWTGCLERRRRQCCGRSCAACGTRPPCTR